MTHIERITQEYNEPFRSVVKGYAEMRYSRKATARVLGINQSYFYHLCNALGLEKHFYRGKELNSSCKPPGHTKGKIIHQPRDYSDWYLISILRGYSPRITIERFNQMQIKPSAYVFIQRFGGWRKAKKFAHQNN